MKQNYFARILFLALCLTVSTARSDITDLLVNDDNLLTTHERPRVAVAPSGSFVIAWADQRSGQSDIYFQRVSALGTRINSNQLVNLDTLGAWQAYPALGVASTGEYSIVWQDFRHSSYPYDPDIFLQRTDSGLTAVGENTSTFQFSGSIQRRFACRNRSRHTTAVSASGRSSGEHWRQDN